MISVRERAEPAESIGSLRCSPWYGEPAKASPGLSWGFSFWIVVGIGLFFAWAKWVLHLIESGAFEASRWLMLGFLGTMYAGALAGTLLSKRRKVVNVEAMLPPRPRGEALPALVAISDGNSSRGRSRGWVWFEGPWLCFEGERFRFRLARRDCKGTNPGSAWVRGRIYGPILDLPKGLPSSTVRIAVLWDHELKAKMLSLADAWEVYSEPTEDSLLPPLRPSPEGARMVPRLRWMIPAAVVAGMTQLVPILFQPYIAQQNFIIIGLASFAMLATVFEGSYWAERVSRNSVNKQIDRYIVKSRR